MTERHPRDATEDPMIRFDRASKRYRDGTVAVHDLSLAVRKASLWCWSGRRGAADDHHEDGQPTGRAERWASSSTGATS